MAQTKTVTTGERDTATVRSDGTSLATTIEGVKTRSTVNHVDHRGTVFEIYEGDNDYWTAPVVYAYQFSIRPGQIKGWGLHEQKLDRYTIIGGEVLVVLFDARAESPTAGVVQKVMMSERAVRQLTIPTYVWHLNVNMGHDDALLVNFPTEVYHHDAPDRLLLPWDTDQIPVDVVGLLPKF